jgi:hypothetical protein
VSQLLQEELLPSVLTVLSTFFDEPLPLSEDEAPADDVIVTDYTDDSDVEMPPSEQEEVGYGRKTRKKGEEQARRSGKLNDVAKGSGRKQGKTPRKGA